jgi:hypothetical protein
MFNMTTLQIWTDQSNTPALIPGGALQIQTGVQIEKQNTGSIHQTNYTYNTILNS